MHYATLMLEPPGSGGFLFLPLTIIYLSSAMVDSPSAPAVQSLGRYATCRMSGGKIWLLPSRSQSFTYNIGRIINEVKIHPKSGK